MHAIVFSLSEFWQRYCIVSLHDIQFPLCFARFDVAVKCHMHPIRLPIRDGPDNVESYRPMHPKSFPLRDCSVYVIA